MMGPRPAMDADEACRRLTLARAPAQRAPMLDRRPTRRALVVLCAVPFVAAQALPAAARVVVPAEKRYLPYTGELAPCDDPNVLSDITDNFTATQSEYWNTTIAILNYDHIRSIGIRPWGLDHIPRTFCTARATLSDHSVHDVTYSVGEALGFSGFGDSVTWCVSGYDQEFAYAPNCKEARP